MRTTVTLDADVAERLKQLMTERNLSFKEAVNSTLRKGLGTTVEARPYVVPTHALELRPGIDGDRIVHVADEMADSDRLRRMGYGL
ncbi:MAG TPA: antitoxin [Acidimicrobiia bacterium]|nr:antitoxin [Acidimicrobiia bacterium]